MGSGDPGPSLGHGTSCFVVFMFLSLEFSWISCFLDFIFLDIHVAEISHLLDLLPAKNPGNLPHTHVILGLLNCTAKNSGRNSVLFLRFLVFLFGIIHYIRVRRDDFLFGWILGLLNFTAKGFIAAFLAFRPERICDLNATCGKHGR